MRATTRLKHIAYSLLPIALLCSCTRTVYLPAETVRHRTDTLRVCLQRTDTVIDRDSIVIHSRSDTVFKTVYRERLRCRERIDTVYSHAADTARVSMPYPVERPLSSWQKAKMCAGEVLLLLLLALAGCSAFRLIYKLKK